MNNIKKLIFKTQTQESIPPIGIPSTVKRGAQSCLGGICTLHDSVVEIIVYTATGNIEAGEIIYSDSNLTTPYLTNSFLKEDLGINVYGVDSFGMLYLNCITDEGC